MPLPHTREHMQPTRDGADNMCTDCSTLSHFVCGVYRIILKLSATRLRTFSFFFDDMAQGWATDPISDVVRFHPKRPRHLGIKDWSNVAAQRTILASLDISLLSA